MPISDIRAALDAIQQPESEPSPDDTQQAQAQLAEAAAIYEDPSQRARAAQLLADAKQKLETIGADDASRHVGKALKGLRQGRASRRAISTTIPDDKEITIREAAEILNVSRPFLVKLLDRGEIPHHRVGTHRRLSVSDVLAYRELRAARRREELRGLTELSEQVEGGYR